MVQRVLQTGENKYSNWYIWTDGTWAPIPEELKDRFIQGYARRDGQFMRNFTGASLH